MKIFQSFLSLFLTAILWMIPVDNGIYDFRSMERQDTFSVTTGAGETIADVILLRPVFDDNTATITFVSSLTSDIPAYNEYDTGTRELTISGLTAETSRMIVVSYDVESLEFHPAVETIVSDVVPILWIIFLILFPVVSLVAIIKGWI